MVAGTIAQTRAPGPDGRIFSPCEIRGNSTLKQLADWSVQVSSASDLTSNAMLASIYANPNRGALSPAATD
jgi:hypothetical protein